HPLSYSPALTSECHRRLRHFLYLDGVRPELPPPFCRSLSWLSVRFRRNEFRVYFSAGTNTGSDLQAASRANREKLARRLGRLGPLLWHSLEPPTRVLHQWQD